MRKVKYTTRFTVKNGRIKTTQVLGEEHATIAQKETILAVKPMLRQFVKSKLSNDVQTLDCVVEVRVSYLETGSGLQVSFKI